MSDDRPDELPPDAAQEDRLIKAALQQESARDLPAGQDKATESIGHLLVPGLSSGSSVIPLSSEMPENSLDIIEMTGFSLPESIPGYRILREIHRGGQGVVYEAIQVSTGRTVAVKVMLEGVFAGDRSRSRFEREVKLIARLRHPNIVVLHDSGIAQGRYFFAMDYIRGQPLDMHVRLSNSSVRDTVCLFLKVCSAVGYAHRRGVIHRDLKPSNILVGENNEPQVLDFGLAKIIGDEAGKSHDLVVTQTGQLMGTLRYMSPEQTLGNPDTIDTRTDVYTLGVILYELLTSRAPYDTNTDLAVALKTIREIDPPRPSRVQRGLNSELDAIVLKTMQKEQDRRYQSVAAFEQDLVAWLDNRPVTARSDSTFYVLRKLAVRHYFQTSMVAAVIAAMVGFGAISYHTLQREREARRSQEMAESSAVAANLDMSKFIDTFSRQYAVGWLLLEWRTGHEDRAREILAELQEGSPEHTAMRYLIDGDLEASALRSLLPPDATVLYHFVLGERYLAEGDRAEARAQFEACATAPGRNHTWFRKSAAARLTNWDTLATMPAPVAPMTASEHD